MSLIARLLWSHFFGVMVVGVAVADDALFSGAEVLDVTLTGPIGDTARDKRRPSERAFRIAVGDQDWPVAVRTRGKSRLVYCGFPPLRLNFAEGETTSGPFAGLDKVKLVTQCRDSSRSRDDLLEEYAAYRMLNAVTSLSHRVRLLRIRYVDSKKPKRDPVVEYAFPIEPLQPVAHRNLADVLPLRQLVVSRVNRDQAALVFVFQYLIANLDWSLVRAKGDDECCHNVKVLTAGDEQLLVPYDFDLSGLVEMKQVLDILQIELGEEALRIDMAPAHGIGQVGCPAPVEQQPDSHLAGIRAQRRRRQIRKFLCMDDAVGAPPVDHDIVPAHRLVDPHTRPGGIKP